MILDADDAALAGLRWADEQGVEAHTTRAELLAALSVSFTVPASEWSDPYPMPPRDVVLRSEWCHGHPPLADAFHEAAGTLKTAGRKDDAFRHLCAAAAVYAAFGCAGFLRCSLLREGWALARELGHLEDALAAARCVAALTEPDDFLTPFAQEMIGIALLESGRAAEALPHFERVVAARRALDHKNKRTRWVKEAEEQLARARSAAGEPGDPT